MIALEKRTGGPSHEAARIKETAPQSTDSNDCFKHPFSGELPQFLKDLIASVPAHGNGVHDWLFKVSRQLHAHRDEQAIVDLLTAAVDGCGRHVPHSEILAAVRDSEGCAWKPSGTARPAQAPTLPKWPALDVEKRRAIIEAEGITLADIWHASPISCTRDSTDAEFFADELFPGNPLLCVGMDMRTFSTAPRESFRGKLSGMSLIVPSPMSALLGKKKNPKPGEDPLSAHSLDNTGPRRYLVTEFDSGTQDEQAAIIWHLRQFAPLRLVLWSGGKSIHSWWDCEGIAESITGRFFRYAVSLGADSKIWTRSQFVRLPQGWRDDKQQRQEVYFFAPKSGGAQ
jgi:hypothetical protein